MKADKLIIEVCEMESVSVTEVMCFNESKRVIAGLAPLPFMINFLRMVQAEFVIGKLSIWLCLVSTMLSLVQLVGLFGNILGG